MSDGNSVSPEDAQTDATMAVLDAIAVAESLRAALALSERRAAIAERRAEQERDAHYFATQRNVMTAGLMSLEAFRERHAMPWEPSVIEGGKV